MRESLPELVPLIVPVPKCLRPVPNKLSIVIFSEVEPSTNGTKSPDFFHKKLGKIMWEYVGMSRNEEGLKFAIQVLKKVQKDFWNDLRVLGDRFSLNAQLEKAGRVADLLELGVLFAKDALQRQESCGGHFREESVELDGPQKGEAKRDDENYSYVSAWEFIDKDSDPILHKEHLEFKDIELKQRSYK